MTPPGGKRKGAGRPKSTDPRVTLAVRVKQSTRRQLGWLSDDWGQSQGEIIDWMVEHLGERHI